MNKYKILSLTALVMMLFSMVFAAAGPAAAADKQITRADVFAFDPFPAVGQQVPEAWAKLTTDENGAGLLMQTSNLIPGDAVTIWWIIFNYPEECAAFPAGSCGLDDLENPAVAPEILYATGAVINGSLTRGRWAGCRWRCPTVRSRDREILVLAVLDSRPTWP
jgi:hypothetical protein